MEKKTYTTELNDNVSMIERTFYHDGEEYTEVLVHDRLNDMVEYIGTSYDGMQYYYNKNYIVLVKDEDVEFAFDVRRFCFITNEISKLKAFKNILKDSKSEYTKEETDLKIEKEERYMIKKYYLKKEEEK